MKHKLEKIAICVLFAAFFGNRKNEKKNFFSNKKMQKFIEFKKCKNLIDLENLFRMCIVSLAFFFVCSVAVVSVGYYIRYSYIYKKDFMMLRKMNKRV